jgi:outer membrane protein OmpA-like peptidoglycan-associated protein
VSSPDLYFDRNSHVLPARERRKLDQIASSGHALHDFSERIVVIEDHCDDWSVHEYNEQLGLERADAVRRIPLNLSFPEDRVGAVSFGDRAPQCLTPDEVCR